MPNPFRRKFYAALAASETEKADGPLGL